MTPKEKHDLAATFFAANRNDEALACLRSLLAEQESTSTWNDYAVIHFASGKFDEAEVAFRVALSIDTHNAQAAFSLGALLHQQSRLAEALPFLRQGLTSPASAESSMAEQLLSTYPVTPLLEPAQSARRFEKYLRTFLRDDPNERSYFETHVHRYVATLQALPQGNPSLRLLELGAAFHHLSPALKTCKNYGEVRCTDIWNGEAQEARLLRANDGNEELQVTADNFDLQSFPWPYPDAAFDVWLCCEILEHLHTDPMGLLAEINRVLTTGGTLFLSTPNLASAHAVEQTLHGASPYGYGKFEFGGKATDRHNREYTAGEVERIAVAAGFHVAALRTHDFYWPAHRDVLRLLASQGHSIARRGDSTFLVAHKRSDVLERFPEEFYAREGIQANRRQQQSGETFIEAPPAASTSSALNILLVHEILPHFDCSGSDLRLFESVREIIAQGHTLTFLARDGRNYHRYAPPLQALGVTVISDDADRMRHIGNDARTAWSFRDLLEREQFDVAILFHWFWSGVSVPEHYLDDIRLWSPATRILVLSDDRHGERERRSWLLTALLSDLERGNDFEQREMDIYARADLLLYITETDRRHFLSLQPDLQTEHFPLIAETGAPGGVFNDREGVLFLGNFENLANRDALQWLLGEVWPLVNKVAPDIKLYVAGHGADPALAKDHPEVIWLGKVPELAPAFAARRVFAAPIRYGTGIITKNMHALAHGLPIVTTTVGAEGMQLIHGQHALISDDAHTFADCIVRLYHDESLWDTISQQGCAFIRSEFSLPHLQSQIRKVLARAAAIQPKPFDPAHTWSYRAVEKSNPEVLGYQPAVYRGLLRLLAYWQRGRSCLNQNQPAEALRQYRHIFTLLRGRLSDILIYLQLLQDMARCYRQLQDPKSASLCEHEAQHLISNSKKPLPPGSSWKPNSKKTRRDDFELSIVVPTYNRTDKLRLCLAALAFQTLPASRWEVIVVDDGSTDDTESCCRNLLLPYPNLRYIRQENRGAGAARRLGVEAARGEILLFCNDDTIADNRLLAEHLRAHRDNPHEKWAVLGDFIPSDDTASRALSFFVNVSEFFFPQKTLKPHALYDQTYFVTCNLSIRRDAVLAAGNFDPQFRVAEDTELGTRLLQNGYRVRYHPDAIAWHEHARFTTDDLIRRAQRYGVADWALFRKHPHLLGAGAGVFGTLSNADEIRMQQIVDSNREAVATGLIALRALDDIDLRAMVHNSTDKGQAAKDAMRQMAQVVPLVYWHHLFETFLQEWHASKIADVCPASPSTRTQLAEVI